MCLYVCVCVTDPDMPRQLVWDALTGGYGWESEFAVLVRKSLKNMLGAGIHNRREHGRYETVAAAISANERQWKLNREHELRQVRADLLLLRVSKTMYSEYSLYNREPAVTEHLKVQRESTVESLPKINSGKVNKDVDTDTKPAPKSGSRTFNIYGTDNVISELKAGYMSAIQEEEHIYPEMRTPTHTNTKADVHVSINDDSVGLKHGSKLQATLELENPLRRLSDDVGFIISRSSSESTRSTVNSKDSSQQKYIVANCRSVVELKRAMRSRAQQLYEEMSADKVEQRKRLYARQRITKSQRLPLASVQS